MRQAVLVSPLIAAAMWVSPVAAADISPFTHSISTQLTGTNGVVVAQDSDSENLPADYTEILAANIGGADFNSDVGMFPSGIFGLAGSMLRTGTLESSVSVVDLVENNRAVPITVSTTFIVFDSFLNLVGQGGTSLSYDLFVGLGSDTFLSSGVLTGAPDFSSSFASTGDSLGAVQTGNFVNIPFQAHTLETVLQPGDAVFFSYDFKISGQAPGGPDGALEILSFEFRDPAATGGLASFDATPLGPSQVPLPASALLLAAGFAVGLARRRARRR